MTIALSHWNQVEDEDADYTLGDQDAFRVSIISDSIDAAIMGISAQLEDHAPIGNSLPSFYEVRESSANKGWESLELSFAELESAIDSDAAPVGLLLRARRLLQSITLDEVIRPAIVFDDDDDEIILLWAGGADRIQITIPEHGLLNVSSRFEERSEYRDFIRVPASLLQILKAYSDKVRSRRRVSVAV